MTDPDDRRPADGGSAPAPAAGDGGWSVLDDEPAPPPEPSGHALDDEPGDAAGLDDGAAGIWRTVEPDEPAPAVEVEMSPSGDAPVVVDGVDPSPTGWIVVEPQVSTELEPDSVLPQPVDAPDVLPLGDGTAAGWMVVEPDAAAPPVASEEEVVEVAPDPAGPAEDVPVEDLVLHRPGDSLVATEEPLVAYEAPPVEEPGTVGVVGSAPAAEGEATTATKRPRTRRGRRDSSFKSLLPAIIAGPLTIALMTWLLPYFGLRLPWSSKPAAAPQRSVPVRPAPPPKKKKPKKPGQAGWHRPGHDVTQFVART